MGSNGSPATTPRDPLRVYVSGPMTGIPAHNFPAFERAAGKLRAEGLDVVSPHELPHSDCGQPGSIPWATYLREDLAAMLTCDAIVLLPGWDCSRGATFELYVATQVGLSVWHFEDS
jgi:hypothetical protein